MSTKAFQILVNDALTGQAIHTLLREAGFNDSSNGKLKPKSIAGQHYFWVGAGSLKKDVYTTDRSTYSNDITTFNAAVDLPAIVKLIQPLPQQFYINGYSVEVRNDGAVQVGCTLVRPTTFAKLAAATKNKVPKLEVFSVTPEYTSLYSAMDQEFEEEGFCWFSSKPTNLQDYDTFYFWYQDGIKYVNTTLPNGVGAVLKKNTFILPKNYDQFVTQLCDIHETTLSRAIHQNIKVGNGYTVNIMTNGNIVLGSRTFTQKDVAPVFKSWKAVMAKKAK